MIKFLADIFSTFVALGKRPSRPQRTYFQRSSNFQRGKFKYPLDTRINYSPKAVWSVLREYVKGNPRVRPQSTIPFQPMAKSTFNSKLNKAAVTWLGHSTSVIELEGNILLLDPVFENYSSPFKVGGQRYSRHMPIEIRDLPEIDAVLISHDHFDHLEYRTIKKVKTK